MITSIAQCITYLKKLVRFQHHDNRISPLVASGVGAAASSVILQRDAVVQRHRGLPLKVCAGAGPAFSAAAASIGAAPVAVDVHRCAVVVADGGAPHRHDARVHHARRCGVLADVRLSFNAQATQIAFEVLPEYTGHAIQRDGIDA
uniref:Uncharacterized protein n=1 Tax=Bactrocera dorsalis TaxID=27457 RepID=A0A034W7N8_BACDO